MKGSTRGRVAAGAVLVLGGGALAIGQLTGGGYPWWRDDIPWEVTPLVVLVVLPLTMPAAIVGGVLRRRGYRSAELIAGALTFLGATSAWFAAASAWGLLEIRLSDPAPVGLLVLYLTIAFIVAALCWLLEDVIARPPRA